MDEPIIVDRRQFLRTATPLAVAAVSGLVAVPLPADPPADAQPYWGQWAARWVREDPCPVGGDQLRLHVGYFYHGNHHAGTVSGVLWRPGADGEPGHWTFRVGNSFSTFPAADLAEAQRQAARQMHAWLLQSLNALSSLAFIAPRPEGGSLVEDHH